MNRVATLCLLLAGLLPCSTVPAADGGNDFFKAKIEPLLQARCFECHSHSKKIKGGLALDSKPGWEKGGGSGPAVVPGRPAESLLLKAVSHAEKDLKMPPKQMLPAGEIALLTEWVRRGAPDPRATPLSATAAADLAVGDAWAVEFQKRLDWWSLKPLSRAAPPAVKDKAWAREPVDRFVRASLDAARLSPAKPAEPEVLLRRASFVLTGLPPTPEQRREFLQHWQRDRVAAYERLVDDLLASPHFGEHFARHWMDVVRYTDTYGYEWDNPAKGSWEFRDYLIRAFNADVGFDQLVREQLAGDLLASPRVDRESGINESLIGPMFYHLGEHRHGSSLMFNGIHQEMVNNKIDAFSKAFLATTVACARCHDHKLEAVSQRDYYALAAVFMTPRWTSRVVDAPGKNDAAIAKLKELRADIRGELAKLWLATANDAAAWNVAFALKGTNTAKLDEVAHPVEQLMRTNSDVAKVWGELAAEWRAAREQRIKANAAFKVLADFQTPALPAGWVTEGDGMKHGYVTDGTPLIALDGDAVVARLLPCGYHTHALSSRLPGALRTPPEREVLGSQMSVQVAGGGFGGYLVMEGNAFQNETVKFFTPGEPAWSTFADAELKNGVTQVTVEFATAALNPNFPPRTGLAKGLKNSDLGYDKRSWLSVTGIVGHDKPGAPQDPLDHFAALYGEAGPVSRDEAAQRLGAWFSGAVRRWCEDRVSAGDVRVLDFLLAKKLLPNRAPAGSALARKLAEYRRVEQGIAFPRTVNSMDERETAQARYALNVRGNVDVLGEPVRPDFLQMFAGRNEVARSRGSGRMELADSLLQPDHPLMSRVYVNRVWSWVFGTGLVATPDDFGRLGDRPSHPALLDYLAREFMREGWSTKQLVRRLVLSETFRQGGTVGAAARER
ncbi:MAG: PSD1 and planctomycete cytochrome C domain-containing protein, partial [Limisphaerales bacterium]